MIANKPEYLEFNTKKKKKKKKKQTRQGCHRYQMEVPWKV